MRDRLLVHEAVSGPYVDARNGTLTARHPPISGYAPHPEESTWLLVLALATLVYLAALTLIR